MDTLPMSGPDTEGFYSTQIELPSGEHEYKFVLDGETWKGDPGNREQIGLLQE